MRLLLLGGTTEARRLATLLAARSDMAVTISLAGRTERPLPQPVPCRIGGFGGVAGLEHYLRAEAIDALIDATHPFARQMATHAAIAAAAAGIWHIRLERPAWVPGPADRWTELDGLEAALTAIGPAPRRIFAAIGKKEAAALKTAPQHDYLLRSVDAPDPAILPPVARILTAIGPFVPADEERLLAEHRIEAVLCKNAGGDAAFGKLIAARALGLPVWLVARPALPPMRRAASVEAVLAALDAQGPSARRGA